jgi:hypothetical protein
MTMTDNPTTTPAAQVDAPLKVHPLPKVKKHSWRKVLPVHPAADVFDPMGKDELRTLAEDIRKRGVKVPVVLWAEDHTKPVQLLDGRNRLDAMELEGFYPVKADGTRSDGLQCIKWQTVFGQHQGLTDTGTAEQRRDVLVKLVAAQPEKSDRAIAVEAGVHHSAISRARKAGGATGAVAPVQKRVGKDGKACKQPVVAKNILSPRARKRLQAATVDLANKLNPTTKDLAANGNGADPAGSAEARKRQFDVVDAILSPPSAETKAKRQAAKILRTKGEQAAKDLLAKDRDVARWLYDILRDPNSGNAFFLALMSVFIDEEMEAEKDKAAN